MGRKIKWKQVSSLFFLSISLWLSGCSLSELQQIEESVVKDSQVSEDLSEVTEAYQILNDNQPKFSDKEKKTKKAFEEYSDLDKLGRCGVAYANICKEIMPEGKRSAIGSVKPSGWQTAKYDMVDGSYLYNRCHLIGYQLAGENANKKNLITGTRFLNVEGMLPFENQVADYVKETGNHVLYRVTPVFEGDNLVASGVELEAYSVEDKGSGVCFYVFAYNVQPGIEIDYATGESKLSTKVDINEWNRGLKTSSGKQQTKTKETQYVLNTNTKKFHNPNCSSVKDTASANKQTYTGSREELIEEGYTPCSRCHP